LIGTATSNETCENTRLESIDRPYLKIDRSLQYFLLQRVSQDARQKAFQIAVMMLRTVTMSEESATSQTVECIQSWCSTYINHVDSMRNFYFRFGNSLKPTVELVELLLDASICAGRIEEIEMSQRLKLSARAILASLRSPKAN
jgi:hypothetical protein